MVDLIHHGFLVCKKLYSRMRIMGEVEGMDLKTLAVDIREGRLSPVYLFYGQEQYLIEDYIKRIEKKIFADGNLDFNFNEYDLKETSIQEVLVDGETFPFMADKRMVVAANAFFLTSSRVSGAMEHDVDSLQRYLENPPDYTVLIIVIPGEKPDERKKVTKTLRKQAVCVEFPPLREGELINWIQRQGAKNKVEIEHHAIPLLLSITGSDLRTLQQEIAKMALYVGEGGTITGRVVDLLASRQLEQNIFQLVEYTARRETDKALRMYYDLLLNKEEPIKILVLMARQFRILLQIKIMGEKGYSPQQIAQALGLKPFVMRKAYDQARFFSEKELIRILRRLAEEDHRIKSGKVDKNMALELFMMGLNEKKKP